MRQKPQNVFCSFATIRLRVGDTSPAPIEKFRPLGTGDPSPTITSPLPPPEKLGRSTAADLTVGPPTPRAAKPYFALCLPPHFSALTNAEKCRRFLPLESCQNVARFAPPKTAENQKSTSCVSSLNKTQNIVLYIMIRFYYTKFLALCQHFWHFFCPKNTILCTLQKITLYRM